MRLLASLLLILSLGCEAQPTVDQERVRAAVAVAEAEVTAAVIPWEGDLPLIEPTEAAPVPQGSAEVYPGPKSEPESVPFAAGPDAECDELPRDTGAREVATDRIRWWAWTPANVKLAEKANRPILLHMFTDNCAFCIKMDRVTFRDPQVIAAVNRDYTPIKINASKFPAKAKAWAVTEFPCDVVVGPQSLREVSRAIGYHSPSEYLKLLKSFEQRCQRKLMRNVVDYPIRDRWWTGCSSWRHLADASAHRGKFDRDWLQDLTWPELQSLHSDDHENKVQWAYVVRP